MDETLQQLRQDAELGDLEPAHRLALMQFKLANHYVLDYCLKLIDLIEGQLYHWNFDTVITSSGTTNHGRSYHFEGFYKGFEARLVVSVPFRVLKEFSLISTVASESAYVLGHSSGVRGILYLKSEPGISGFSRS